MVDPASQWKEELTSKDQNYLLCFLKKSLQTLIVCGASWVITEGFIFSAMIMIPFDRNKWNNFSLKLQANIFKILYHFFFTAGYYLGLIKNY